MIVRLLNSGLLLYHCTPDGDTPLLAREYTVALQHRRVETRKGRPEALTRRSMFGLRSFMLPKECKHTNIAQKKIL